MSSVPDPKTAFGGKPMGGLARIVHYYFSDQATGLTPVPEKALYTKTEPPYVSNLGTDCTQCGAGIKVMAFIGSGVCSEICRKVGAGEISAHPQSGLRGGSDAVRGE